MMKFSRFIDLSIDYLYFVRFLVDYSIFRILIIDFIIYLNEIYFE